MTGRSRIVMAVAALLASLLKEWLGVELEPESVEIAVETILTIIVAFGLLFKSKKEKEEEKE